MASRRRLIPRFRDVGKNKISSRLIKYFIFLSMEILMDILMERLYSSMINLVKQDILNCNVVIYVISLIISVISRYVVSIFIHIKR